MTLATDAIIGAMASPSMPGTAYVLFHHVMGECDGVRGVWGYVRGGMGGISNAIASAARESRGRDPDQRRGGQDPGEGRDGAGRGAARRHRDPRHAGGLRRGRERHLPQADGERRPALGVRGRGAPHRLRSASCKINIALGELPDFKAAAGHAPGPQHRGTIHISPTMEYIERAYDDAKYGRPVAGTRSSRRRSPRLSTTRWRPPGKYVMSMFTQYFPYKLAPGLSLERGEGEVRRPLLRSDERVRAQLQARRSSPGRCSRRWTWRSGSGSPAGTSCRA